MRAARSLQGIAGVGLSTGFATSRKHSFCENNDKEIDDGFNSIPSLIQQADDVAEAAKAKIKTPTQFDQIKLTMGGFGAQTFDGFRCVVQKQVNLNTAVSHFYWLGSQAVPPIYKYYLIFHDEDKMINVNTDMDLNLEGEIKGSIAPNVNAKINFTLGEQGKSGTAHIDYTGDTFTSQLELASTGPTSLGLSYMQAVHPTLSLGGCGKYSLSKGILSNSFGGVYEKGENVVYGLWDNQLQVVYLRRVNRNRVHLTSQLVVDENLRGQGILGAEFILKQSKLNFSIDSDLLIKSGLETSIGPAMNLQVTAEMQHASNAYRFGYGIMIG
mmetsp:Transcript_35150/g.35792  ORF Transcript_35150/g.35792 Transcript_35150/m.35792 type:complete len:327 (+) Transcript_35150:115-1095(+)|eukprot:CAMPEP_0182419436 /NCGR_PEP_ID=MMETSP1167-20130531/3904_1 /TAXON_ID=2988 /ORGANISM="Mallomonas Sp, Strain CCMP3275" /LENGTH=326 /DNA_ID=CAMNT_0024594373 /DNA_START=108 /DNA_END=1088 /DNA_ORIENTATION=+